MAQRLCCTLAMGLALSLMMATPSWGQFRSSMIDAVRGVTFHSVEISNDSVADLNVLDGAFSSDDRLVVGLSTMLFNGSDEISTHIVWIRHEGRRWLDYGLTDPVSIIADGWEVPLESLRSPQPFVGDGARMIEKHEFLVDSSHFDRLLAGEEITVRLHSETGVIDKMLTDDEIRQLRQFLASIGPS